MFMGNSLLAMYMNCDDKERARWGFDKMLEGTIVSWNIIISGYHINGNASDALMVCTKMMDVGCEADSSTVVSVRAVDLWVFIGLRFDLLGRAGGLDEVYELIRSMPFQATHAVWGALMRRCADEDKDGTSSKAWNEAHNDPIRVPIGLVTRSRMKKLKK
ncbi:hypothetical protein LguiB_008996 [Lonicera macranthoides]